jgi:thioredoxin reductase (NADPH)
MEIWDSIIVGSGSAGATAGLYISRNCLKNLLLTGPQRGGLLTTTHIVENFPGVFPAVSGYELMEIMLNQAAHYGTVIQDEEVMEVIVIEDFLWENKPINLFKITTHNNIYYGKTVVWATGSTPNKLGVYGEYQLENKGVSYCAVCDGFFFKNKVVAVIGGGNSAMEESLFLSNIVHKVYLVHRRNEFRGEQILYQEIIKTSNIELKTPNILDKINGKEFVESIDIKNPNTGIVENIPVEGVFIAIGHNPNTQLIKAMVNLDENNYVNAVNGHTNIKGLFVAGDVQDSVYRQAVTAAASGCIAAMEIIKFLKSL